MTFPIQYMKQYNMFQTTNQVYIYITITMVYGTYNLLWFQSTKQQWFNRSFWWNKSPAHGSPHHAIIQGYPSEKNISPTYPPSHPHCISRKWLVYPWLSPQKVVGLPIFSWWNRHFHEMITWSCLKPHETSIQSPWIGPFNGHFGWNRLMRPSPPSSPRCCDLGSSIDGIGRHGSAHRCAIRFSVPVGWAAKNAAGSLLGTPFWGWIQCFHRWPLWRNETSKSTFRNVEFSTFPSIWICLNIYPNSNGLLKNTN